MDLKVNSVKPLPIVADDKSIINSYELSKYSKIGENSVFSFIFFARAVNSFDDDVRVSKRIYIPSRKLRGFASGKIGPKDGLITLVEIMVLQLILQQHYHNFLVNYKM